MLTPSTLDADKHMHCRFEAGLTAEQKSAGAQRALAREARAEAAARVAAKRCAPSCVQSEQPSRGYLKLRTRTPLRSYGRDSPRSTGRACGRTEFSLNSLFSGSLTSTFLVLSLLLLLGAAFAGAQDARGRRKYCAYILNLSPEPRAHTQPCKSVKGVGCRI